jgi:hypothetical protein
VDESLLFAEFVQRSFAFEGNGFQWLTLYSPLSIYSSVNIFKWDGMEAPFVFLEDVSELGVYFSTSCVEN